MTDEETEKENSINPEEEETSEKKPSNEDQETSQNPETSKELEEKNKRLYARLKKQEEENKELKQKFEKSSKDTSSSEIDVEVIAKTIEVFDGLDQKEKERLIKEAKANSISLEEARKDEDFDLWRSAYAAKKEKDNAPEPSNKHEGGEGKALADMTSDEKQDFLEKDGFVKPFPKPKPL